MADIANSTTAPAAQAPSAFKTALDTYVALQRTRNAPGTPEEEMDRLADWLHRAAGDILLFQSGVRFDDLVVAEQKADTLRATIERHFWPDGRERRDGETRAEWLDRLSEGERDSGFDLASDLEDGITASLGSVYDDAKAARATMPETFAIKARIAAHDCLFQGAKDADWPEWRDSLMADLQGMAHPSESEELERICAEATAAERDVSDWLWVEDEPKQREVGRSPTDADIRTLEAAHSRREDAVDALYSFEPTSIRELWRKAQAMKPHALCEEDVALDVLIGDLARMAGATI
jgi:hypothetical protein